MMEVCMAMAKMMSVDDLVNEMDKDLKTYKADPSEKNKKKLNFSSMMFTLHNVADKMSLEESIKMVEDMKRKHELFNVDAKTKSN